MTGQLSDLDLARLRRAGLAALTTGDALELFDQALGWGAAHAVPAALDLPALRERAADGTLPTLFGLVVPTVQRRPRAGAPAVAARPASSGLAELPPAEQREALTDLVQASVAAVLAYDSPEQLEPGRSLVELGIDSLTAVELHSRLKAATGLRLPATLVFDYPTTPAIVDYLAGALNPAQPSTSDRVRAQFDRLGAVLIEAARDDEANALATAHLRRLLAELTGVRDDSAVLDKIHSASDDEMFALIDEELRGTP